MKSVIDKVYQKVLDRVYIKVLTDTNWFIYKSIDGREISAKLHFTDEDMNRSWLYRRDIIMGNEVLREGIIRRGM